MTETILVTGASGLVGGAVTRRLASAGFDIRTVSRDPARLAGIPGQPAQAPRPGAGATAWTPLLQGVSHVVHCAGIARGEGMAEQAYQEANVVLTRELAVAAAGIIPGKLVFVSSLRAVAGRFSAEPVTDSTMPAPQDAYGRSKLEAEGKIRAAFAALQRFTILRPAAIYGPGMKGNLAALMRLARLPIPLPFAGVEAPRSLLSLEACTAAVEHVLSSPQTNGRSYIVADRAPLSTADMLRSLRLGLDRPAWLLPLPPRLLSVIFFAAGQRDAWRTLSSPLTADPSGLTATGWRPVENTGVALAALARQIG